MVRTFLKAEALGNDFILLNIRRGESLSPAEVRRWCDRRRGVGADGVIGLWPLAGSGRWRFVLHNSDGERAEISGNGLRCAVAALRSWWLIGRGPVRLETDVGPRRGWLVGDESEVGACGPGRDSVHVAVEMGEPGPLPLPTGPDGLIRVEVALPDRRRSVEGVAVSVGNPHFVVPSDSLPSTAEVLALGAALERHALFAAGTNVIWAKREPGGELQLRIWERGCGWTPACGSGACAAAWAAREIGWLPAGGGRLRVRMEGGSAEVRLPQGPGQPFELSGVARRVARGEAWLQT